ncbi:MAG: hypothetical protein HDR05_13370 [Lachnospiraceae bacterium]|nr:hypothetical protein [Lachnospiraceae bacterium]
MKNHVKQMLRTPLQLLLIIVLVMIVTVMLVVGGNLWVTSDRISKAYEDDFITIGTVSQKPDTIRERTEWDAEKGDYQIYKSSVYNRYATEEDLAFPEITYLMEPEKRVYWGSYTPEYVHDSDLRMDSNDDFIIVAEFSPLEDCIPNESVKIKITKILGDAKMLEGSVVWFCDHNNRYPDELKADKTYVAKIRQLLWPHGSRLEESGDLIIDSEYVPDSVMPILYTPEGKRIEDTLKMQSIYEVTEGFYETDEGKRLLAISNIGAVYNDTQPVVGTNSTNLLMPFYEENAWVYEGRYPTAEEYAQGSPVCLAPKEFAENNRLSVGDQVMTRLYYTGRADWVDYNFQITGGGGFSISLLGPDGKLLSPFEENAYTIVGLYDYTPSVKGIGREELIVPLASVQNRLENIADFGAMSDENTSFQIENGTIADFIEASAKNGVDNLIYTFYDRGYSALMEGIQNLKNMSAALLIMGSIAAVILTLQISHIYITKQKRRLSIERLLGMTGKRCRNICLAGILILLILGTVPGVAVGMAVSEQVKVEDIGQDGFNRKYSNLGLSAQTEIDLSGQAQGDLAVSCGMGVLVLVLCMSISSVTVHSLLKGEPLYLLESQEKV